MNSEISANKTTIHKMLGRFATSQFRVPDYQRGYSWESKDITAFFDDIMDFAETRRDDKEDAYFLGPIVMMKGDASDDYYYIVDGQQRLATSVILLATIRDLAAEAQVSGNEGRDLADEIHKKHILSEGNEGGERWSLRLGDLDQSFFRKCVQRRDRTVAAFPRNASNGLIKRARNHCEKELRGRIGERSAPLDYLRNLYQLLPQNSVGFFLTHAR